mmetsp:Transcript_4814/g.10566  ORF Transcript_4814/g.10566 Transcript_4814/m.10566 type:complete len:93 (-) Transcript_4814:1379-1657(-)
MRKKKLSSDQKGLNDQKRAVVKLLSGCCTSAFELQERAKVVVELNNLHALSFRTRDEPSNRATPVFGSHSSRLCDQVDIVNSNDSTPHHRAR